ncbi:MAG: GrpB family protein [Parachlamydiales bacterium]|jgi:GrpB-like predicted nucleotidyltransferase (UPF0157 family)
MEIEIVEYNPKWIKIYKKEANTIQDVLGDNCLAIYHFGSTSVPNLKAKAKVDILAVVKNLSLINNAGLEKIGFENRGEVIKMGRYFCKKTPRIHLHIFEENNPNIEKNLKFRDWLRTHEDDRNEYAKLKIDLAKIYDDGMEYCEAKTDFINKILDKIDDVIKNNQEKFKLVRKLNLPINQYAITGSGPLGVRKLKKINDIDMIVSDSLWNDLILKYPVIEQNNIKKICIPNQGIEIFCEASFNSPLKGKDEPTVIQRIKSAEIIDGLPFESIEYTLHYKYKMRREKDLKDIKIIEEWQAMQKLEEKNIS